MTEPANLRIDRLGYLTARGVRLVGYRLDMTTGARFRAVPEPLRAPPERLPPARTSAIDYAVNLPPSASAAPGMAWACDAAAEVAPEAAGAFIDATLPGGSVVLYAEDGASAALVLRWARLQGGAPNWALFYASRPAGGYADAAWRPLARLAGAGARIETAEALSIDGRRFGPAALSVDASHFADRTGCVRIRRLSQDGRPGGALTGMSIEAGGLIRAHYADGRMPAFAEISAEIALT